jgi:hypothetical protein
VAVRDAYPGIDLIFYGNQHQLEYDAVVAPGADPSRIRVKFVGAKGLKYDDNGDVIVSAGATELRVRKPVVYQMSGRSSGVSKAPIRWAETTNWLSK